ARARRQGAQGDGAAASGQSPVGDSGRSSSLEVHSLARVMRTLHAWSRSALMTRCLPTTHRVVLDCNFDPRVYTRTPDQPVNWRANMAKAKKKAKKKAAKKK